MGCVVGSLASMAACCFGSAACHLCCACLPSCRTSTSTRLSFAGIIIVCAIACVVMLAPGLQDDLRKIPFLCDMAVFPNGTDVVSACEMIVGYEAVYRMCFALSCFFFLFAVIMINVRSSKDPRAKFQNGFWGIKIFILAGLIVGAFFIPYGKSNQVISFAKVWALFGMVGAVLFILIQLTLLIDSMHTFNEKLRKRADECNTSKNCWNFLSTLLVIFFYALTGVSVALLYMYYGKWGCTAHQTLISFNLVLCFAISVVSVLPAVHKHLPYSGLLPSSAVSLYATYVIWTGMSNNPDSNCNPNLFSHLLSQITEGYTTTTAYNYTTTTMVYNSTNSTAASVIAGSTRTGMDPVTIISIILWFGSLLFSCLRSSRSETAARLTFSSSKAEPVVYSACNDGSDAENQQGQKVWDDESGGTIYNYSLFHLMLMLSSTYIMMTLTNWFKLSPDLTYLKTDSVSMWLKIATSWVVFFLYLWTLLAPMTCPSRFEQ